MKYDYYHDDYLGPTDFDTDYLGTKFDEKSERRFIRELSEMTVIPEKSVPVIVDDVSWINLEEFLRLLEPSINRLIGRHWHAFSMTDGHCYFQIQPLINAVNTLARRERRLDGVYNAIDRNYIYALIQRLRKETDAISSTLMGENYYMSAFTVWFRGGRVIKKAFYIPFHSEAFKIASGELENRKRGILRQIARVTLRVNRNAKMLE